jgi:ribosomal protein S12 methylthiotransferase accessory factor
MTASCAAAALAPPHDLRMVLQEVPPPDARETLRRASRLVSRRVGILRSVEPSPACAQDPAIFSVAATPSRLSHSPRLANPGNVGGAGETLEAGIAAAIGEAVERYCTLFYDKSQMVLGTWRELGEPAVPPDLLRLFSRQQLEQPGRRTRLDYFDDDSRVRWTWGWSLTQNRARLVPAALVYLGYACDPEEAAIGSNASTGLAAGLTLEGAILSGLYEVVERDAFTISWLFRHVRGKVRVDDAGLRAKMLSAFAADRSDVSLELFDLTLDAPICSLLAVLRRPAEFGPVCCLSAAARLSPAAAAHKCLVELGQGLQYLRFQMAELRDWQPRDDYSDLTTFDHHVILYHKRPQLAAAALAFLDGAGAGSLSALPQLATGRVKGDVERCVELLARAGHEVIAVDITTADVRDAGFRVVRVLAPGLAPLHSNHNLPHLGVERLRQLPWRYGWVERGQDPLATINRLPHPFP